MPLHLIGLGLCDEKDLTARGLSTLQKCSAVYLETYTSTLQIPLPELSKRLGVEILPADRTLVEQKADTLLDQAKDTDVALLVIGDPFCATTHVDLRLRAKEKGVTVNVVHNASILSAIGVIGLEVYKYGKTTSIPFRHEQVKGPLDVLFMNQKNGLHTLFLLDLDPANYKFLSLSEAIAYLLGHGVAAHSLAVGCARIGAPDQIIRAGTLSSLQAHKYGKPPYCLVIPGNLHFMEEEALGLWR